MSFAVLFIQCQVYLVTLHYVLGLHEYANAPLYHITALLTLCKMCLLFCITYGKVKHIEDTYYTQCTWALFDDALVSVYIIALIIVHYTCDNKHTKGAPSNALYLAIVSVLVTYTVRYVTNVLI